MSGRAGAGGSRRARVLLVAGACGVLAASTGAAAAGPPGGEPVTPDGIPGWSAPDQPLHGNPRGITWGGQLELRFGHDREAGVSNPDWFSVGRAGGSLAAQLHPRLRVAARGAYDRGTDDFALEQGELSMRVRPSLVLHAGVFPAPLGSVNQEPDAPAREFGEWSLVATEIIGVPYAELGAGVRGTHAGRWSYELDVVTGYDEGIVTRSPGATRVPSGRNNYGDSNGAPAVAGRIQLRVSPKAALGIAAQSGPYNQTRVGGVEVDRSRWVHVGVVDASGAWAGLRLSGKAAAAIVDIPPGLEGLYAERQWGGSVEVARTLFDPLIRRWNASLGVAARADAVDFDADLPGDSRSRLSASVNFRQATRAVARLGWYYEWRRDRFNNLTPLAGITFTAGTYF